MSDSNKRGNKDDVRKYPLPSLSCGFPFKRNPLEAEADQEWIDWIDRASSLSSEAFDKIRGNGLMVAYYYPFCDDIYRYERLVKYFILFFVWDDHTENTEYGQIGRNKDQSMKIWDQFRQMFVKMERKEFISMASWEPYVFAMCAVLEDMYVHFNEDQKEQFIEVWLDYVEGNLEETELISSGKLPGNFEEFCSIRIKSVGVRPALQAIEYADNLAVPKDVWEDPRMQKLIDLTSINIFMVNDFYSFEKEMRENKNLEKMFSTVALICRTEGIPISKSLVKLTEMIESNEKEIFELEEQLLGEECLPVTKKFVEHINYMIGGNFRSSSLIDRYNKFVIKSDNEDNSA